MKKIIYTMLIPLAAIGFARSGPADLPPHAIPILQNWLYQCSEAVEICVYREQWVVPSEEMPKGMLLKFGIITYVHKGSVEVGERVVMATLVEYGAGQVARARRPSVPAGPTRWTVSCTW